MANTNTSKNKPFEDAIMAMLKQRSAGDALFAKTLKKPNKNIQDCATYILNEVRKSGRQGYADEEILAMAVHFYDEDDLKPGSPVSGAKVIVNKPIGLTEEDKTSAKDQAMNAAIKELKEEAKVNLSGTIELTEEEISEARTIAINKTIEEERQKLTTKKKSSASKTDTETQVTLF